MTSDTILLRQAHPKFMDGDIPTSQVFYPFPKDDGKLSVYDGDQITPADAHRHYTEVLKNESHSVWGVSGVEVINEGTKAVANPLKDFLSHALVDFQGMTDKDCRKKAKKLKAHAVARGCMFIGA